MAPALTAQGVTSIGADNSRESGQRQIGSALTLPRYPMNVFYNVSTWADQLDEYDWLYLDRNAAPAGRGNCTNTAVTTCFTTPVTQAQFIEREASAVVRRMLSNDPRPHYAHQTNIIAGSSEPDVAPPAEYNRGDGILYAVIGDTLQRYRALVKAPFLQPTQTALTQELRRQTAWATATEPRHRLHPGRQGHAHDDEHPRRPDHRHDDRRRQRQPALRLDDAHRRPDAHARASTTRATRQRPWSAGR